MRISAAILILILIAAWPLHAMPLTEGDRRSLQKSEVLQHVQYQTYLETDKGPAGVIGYYFDRYFTQNAFATLGIFGAVSGNRGGYGIAALGLGYRVPISQSVALDFRSLVGSGGGGGVPAGGGLAIHAGVGVLVEMWADGYLDAGYSWLQFPSGTLNTPTIHIGVALKSQMISI